MNIYNLLTEREKAKVDAFSQKVNTEKKTEPLFFKRQLISNYALRLFRENHPDLAEEIQQKQEKGAQAVQERQKELTWDACIFGYRPKER